MAIELSFGNATDEQIEAAVHYARIRRRGQHTRGSLIRLLRLHNYRAIAVDGHVVKPVVSVKVSNRVASSHPKYKMADGSWR